MCGIYRHHLQYSFRRNLGKLLLKCAHFSEQAQIIIAREAIRSETHVEAELLQPFEPERRVSEIGVAARTMRNGKLMPDFSQQIEIAFQQFVQVCNDPLGRHPERSRLSGSD